MCASPVERDARFELTATPAAASQARGLVAVTFSDWGLRQLILDEQLIASELVGNSAMVTPGRNTWLLLARAHDAVSICVWDSSPVLPQKRACKPHAESGRGLHIVAALADGDGAFAVAEPQGKITWARLTV